MVIDNTTIEAGDKFTTTDIDKYYHNGEASWDNYKKIDNKLAQEIKNLNKKFIFTEYNYESLIETILENISQEIDIENIENEKQESVKQKMLQFN